MVYWVHMHHKKPQRLRQQPIVLSAEETERLRTILCRGKENARVLTRARILLLSHQGKAKDTIARDLFTGRSTVQRIRDRYGDGGLDLALYDLPRPGQPPKLDEVGEAHLVALACTSAPEGRDHWTLELLRERMVKDRQVESISTVAIWKRLDARGIKPWREKNVVRAEVNTRIRRAHGRYSGTLRQTV